MPKMTELELIDALQDAESDAVEFNGVFGQENETLLSNYLRCPYGDEVDGQSQVVSNDIEAVVESDMPSLERVFLRGPVANFEPSSSDPADIQEAKDKTEYVNWLINGQTDSFRTQLSFLKDIEIQKMGVLKYFVEDTESVEHHKFEGVNEAEIQQILDSLDTSLDDFESISDDLVKFRQSLDDKSIKSIEIEDRDEPDDELDGFNVTFKVVKARKEIKIVNVPTENFLITRNASNVEDAELVGDISTITRGELLKEGISREKINQLSLVSANNEGTAIVSATVVSARMQMLRFRDQGGTTSPTGINDWASEKVEIRNLIVKVDFDQDGIAERRHIRKSGQMIISNEVMDHVNYVVASAILMPHQAIGRSRAEVNQTTQRVKTVLLRQTLDNGYLVNHAGHIVGSSINLDDMLTVRPNRIIRMTDNNMLPSEAVFPLVTEYTGEKSLQLIQYMDSIRAETTGQLLANQGLTVDSLHKETATRFQGIQEAGQGKIELVARTIKETGYRKLYEGLAWMAATFQDTETEIMVLGSPLIIDPSKWKFKHRVNVSQESIDDDKVTQALTGILSIQEQLKARGSLIVDDKKVFNALDKLVKGVGLQNTREFFNDPEQPDQVLLAQNEMLLNAVESLQQQVQAMANPLAEAEAIAAQKDLIIAEGKAQLDIAEFTDNQEKWRAELEAKVMEAVAKLSLQATDLELESGQEVPGSRV